MQLIQIANELERKMKRLLEEQLSQRAATVMNAIDIQKVLTGEFDEKEIVASLASQEKRDTEKKKEKP